MQVFLDPEIRDLFSEDPDTMFRQAFSMQGEVFRHIKNRKTMRFLHHEKAYFIKLHGGIGWREILKNWLQFKRPVLGARNEYEAIRLMEKLGISTMVCRGFAERGTNPAKMQSFIITDELQNQISLEDVTRNWAKEPPPPCLKNQIIDALAETCAMFHFAGMVHKDCYLCHFLVDKTLFQQGKIKITVLDLHRAEIRPVIQRRMRVKDLAGIFFSSMDAGLKKRDALRFIAKYSSFGALDKNIWRDVLKKAIRLYKKEWGHAPVMN